MDLAQDDLLTRNIFSLGLYRSINPKGKAIIRLQNMYKHYMYLQKKCVFQKFKYKKEIQKLCVRDLKGIFNISNRRGLGLL